MSAMSSTSVSGSVSETTDSSMIGLSAGLTLRIRRRARQIVRQLPARGVDRRLHVLGGGVDVAIEVELHGDRGAARCRCRRHLRDARNLRELPLERLRDRRRHRLGAGAGQGRRDLDGREIDLRQRRDRQVHVGDHADEHEADHHQRRADRVADERRRNTLGHLQQSLKARSDKCDAVIRQSAQENKFLQHDCFSRKRSCSTLVDSPVEFDRVIRSAEPAATDREWYWRPR